MSDDPTPADKKAAEPDIAAMRERLRGAVAACTDLGMDMAVLILENHRLRRLLELARKERAMAWFQRSEATRLLEYALHLRQHGENAPGGSETWREFDTRAEDFLRTHGAAQALNAVTALEWADAAYEMWELILATSSGSIGGDEAAWEAGKDRVRLRLHALIDANPKIKNEVKW